MQLPTIYIARHGETAWTLTGQHTGLTDIPLTPQGESDAARFHPRLAGMEFERVWTSPLQRASRTCELAGFGGVAEVDPDLVEWDYGDFEGLRSAEIRAINPGFQLFRDGAPNGESIATVTARADRVVARLRAVEKDALLFSSGHFLRVLAARWIGLPVSPHCISFLLQTASLGALSYEHSRQRPVISLWNDTNHLRNSDTQG